MLMTPLKLVRLRGGLAQIQLAQAAGILRSRLSEIESGYVSPSDSELERLAFALGLDLDDLQAAAAHTKALAKSIREDSHKPHGLEPEK